MGVVKLNRGGENRMGKKKQCWKVLERPGLIVSTIDGALNTLYGKHHDVSA